jgi:hypothetical protein
VTVAALRPRVALAAPEALLLGALALAMSMCTAWATIAAGWNEGMSLAFATTAIAVIEAVLLASSTAGRVTATIAAPLLGLLVIVPTTIGGLPTVKGDAPGGLRHVVTEYGSAFATGLVGESSWAFIVGFCGGMWLCAFFAAWVAVRERRGLFAALPLYGILASNAINAPRLGAVALPSLLAMGLSLILLTRTTLAFLEQRWRGERVVALPGTHRRFGRTALIAAGAITLLAALVPPLTNTDISGRLFHFNVGNGNGSGDGSGSGAGGPQQATIHFSPNTEPGGPLSEDPQPVLTYTLDGSDSVYLRVIDDTVFDKGNWYPSAHQRPETSIPVQGPIPRDRSAASGAVTTVVKQDRAHIRLASTVTSVADLAQVPFPGEPNSVDRGATAHGDANQIGELLTVDHVDLPSGIGADATLNVIGDNPAATEEQLRKASTNYPAWITANYLALDIATASDRAQLADITALAQRWTAATTNPYDAARQVEAHLRTSPFVYTLTPPATPKGEWPIHAFLINNQHGYCQYFASSMGTMLRALHIPTRLVTGYGPGSVDDTTATSKSPLRSVSTSDAHVWVEAYFSQYGWIPFEPTPSSGDGDYQPIPRPVPAGVTTSPTPEPTAAVTTPTATPTPQAQGGAAAVDTFNPSGPPPALLATVGAVVAIGLLISFLLSWMLRPRTLRAMWKRMRIVGALLGTRKRVNETLGAYCDRLAAELPPDRADGTHRDWRMSRTRAAEDLRLIGDLSGKAAFSRQGLAPAEVTRWRRAWRGLVHLLPRMIWRRLGVARPATPAESRPARSTPTRG